MKSCPNKLLAFLGTGPKKPGGIFCLCILEDDQISLCTIKHMKILIAAKARENLFLVSCSQEFGLNLIHLVICATVTKIPHRFLSKIQSVLSIWHIYQKTGSYFYLILGLEILGQ